MDIVVRHGVDFRQELPLAAEDGKPLSFAGWTLELQVRPRHGANAVFEAQLRHRTGVAVVEIPGEVSREWAFGVGRYELWAVSSKNQWSVPLAGRVLIDRR